MSVKVYCSRFLPSGSADWDAECRLCPEKIWTGDWAACMEWAYGHLIFSHPRAIPVEPPC